MAGRIPCRLDRKGCPYAASSAPSGPDGDEREYPQIPGLDLERREYLLDAVPKFRTRVVRVSIRTCNSGSGFRSDRSMSPYDNHVNFYAEVETESAYDELVCLYRDGLNHPNWEIIDESSSKDLGWLFWTFHDTEGRLWHGRLVVIPLHEGWKLVWLTLYSQMMRTTVSKKSSRLPWGQDKTTSQREDRSAIRPGTEQHRHGRG